jgi:hypothetical protein
MHVNRLMGGICPFSHPPVLSLQLPTSLLLSGKSSEWSHLVSIWHASRVYGLGEHSQYSSLLQARQCRDRILVGARFSAPFQTSPGAHPASCTMVDRSLCQG